MLVRIGSRGSRLALTQAEQAAEALRRPGLEIAFVPITTAGDRDRTLPFGQIGERGVFVKEIEEALLGGRIDVAVHSAKDMTSTDTEGLTVGAYLQRDDPRDALIGASAIRPGMRIGTASARRRAQLLAQEPTLSIEPLRGNVETRLRKQRERGLDAIVLAACGLDRLGLAAEIGVRLEPDVMLPEAAQGALALQVRAGEESLVDARRPLRNAAARRARAPLRRSDRRRLPRAGRSASRRRHSACVDRSRGRSLDRTAFRRRPGRACRGTGGSRGRAMKVIVTRPRAQARQLVAALEAARRGRGRVSLDRDRADLG